MPVFDLSPGTRVRFTRAITTRFGMATAGETATIRRVIQEGPAGMRAGARVEVDYFGETVRLHSNDVEPTESVSLPTKL
jgi:hypothetical protein